MLNEKILEERKAETGNETDGDILGDTLTNVSLQRLDTRAQGRH